MTKQKDFSTRRQAEAIIKSAPDFEKEAEEVTKLLKPIGGRNNG